MDEKLYKKALKRIKIDGKCKPSCFSYIGPTGATDTYDYFFKQIVIILYQKKIYTT